MKLRTPWNSAYLSLPESAKSRARFVYRSPHQHEIDKVRARQKTKAFISKMILRKWTIEGLFAEAKQFHGLKRARYRGLQKVSIQALMTAMAQNIKWVIKQSLDIYWHLRRYPYLRKEILSAQNYLFYFKCMPKLFYINQPGHKISCFSAGRLNYYILWYLKFTTFYNSHPPKVILYHSSHILQLTLYSSTNI